MAKWWLKTKWKGLSQRPEVWWSDENAYFHVQLLVEVTLLYTF